MSRPYHLTWYGPLRFNYKISRFHLASRGRAVLFFLLSIYKMFSPGVQSDRFTRSEELLPSLTGIILKSLRSVADHHLSYFAPFITATYGQSHQRQISSRIRKRHMNADFYTFLSIWRDLSTRDDAPHVLRPTALFTSVCVCTSVSIWRCCWTSHIWTFVLAPHSFSAASKSIRRNKPSMCVAFPHNSASVLRKCVFVFVFKNAKMWEIAESLKRVAAICVRATFAPKCFLFYTYDACKLCFGVRLNRQIVARTMCAQV